MFKWIHPGYKCFVSLFAMQITSNTVVAMEEGGGSPTTTGLLGSGLLFIQQNIVGSCSPNRLRISQGKIPKLLINTQCFDQCDLLQVYRNSIQAHFYRWLGRIHQRVQ